MILFTQSGYEGTLMSMQGLNSGIEMTFGFNYSYERMTRQHHQWVSEMICFFDSWWLWRIINDAMDEVREVLTELMVIICEWCDL